MLVRILSGYGLFIGLCILLSIIFGEYLLIESVNKKSTVLIKSLNSNISQLRVEDISDKLNQIEEVSKTYGLKVFDKELAERWLLESVQDFKDSFAANVLKSSFIANGSIGYEIKFTFKPSNADEIVSMLEFMENTNSPVMNVKSIVIKRNKRNAEIDIETEISQVFYGGDYSYE